MQKVILIQRFQCHFDYKQQLIEKPGLQRQSSLGMKFLMINLILLIIVLQISLSFETQGTKNINNELTFIKSIWQTVKAGGIEEKILNTTFFKDMKKGSLNPICFGRFSVQEIYFETENVKLWKKACDQGQHDQSFISFCNYYYEVEKDFQHQLKDQMFLYAAQPMEITRKYAQQKKKYLQSKSYHHIPIVNYICYRIYIDISQILLSETNSSNAYYEWIEYNSYEEYITQLENKINEYQTYFDKDQITSLFFKFAQYELGLFEASCPVQPMKSKRIFKIKYLKQ